MGASRKRWTAFAVGAVVATAMIVGGVVLTGRPVADARVGAAPDAVVTSPVPSPAASAPYTSPSPAEISALPAARATMEYVIGGLVPFDDGPIVDRVYRLTADAPVYGDRGGAPVARLDAENFLGEPTVIVASRFDGDWALVLTPGRLALPSASPMGTAPAQSAGWVRRDVLTASHAQTHRVVVDTAQRTATIQTWTGEVVERFTVGVGGPENPSPTGITYIQARYLDPSQGQPDHRIQLTGAYSAQSDAPWRGSAHTGLHFSPAPDADSHGCVRMSAEGITAIDALPLGTVVAFVGG